ncbi:MAG: signal recognition particle-docking protein FtsY [Deltaproteobacteria bacterium]|nr:signal recognition particle-docking protein FtsY [Deltaproteobacteria bacterium]
MGVVVGIVAVVVVLAIIVYVVKSKKKELPEATPERAVEPAPPEEPAAEEPSPEEPAPAEEEIPPEEEPEPEEAAPTEEPAAEEAPVEPTTTEAAPGVTLDDKAEQEAAARLKDARRERKLKRLRQGLAPTRGGFLKKISNLFRAKKELDPSLLEELEETLITADVGMNTTEWLIDLLKQALDKKELSDPNEVWDFLREEVLAVLSVDAPPFDVSADKPYTILVVGVNGVGKTTTIGKLATQFTDQGYKVVLAAADTFRAAAVNQLEIWGRRAGAEVVKSKEGADPSSVVFDAIKQAKDTGADIVIADTAGRLQTKIPLMEEVKKIARVSSKAYEKAPHQILLVLDATTGQNAISQVSMFKETLDLSGLVVTKLDGTAKGGVIIGVCHEHGLPIRFIGIGEAKDDLREFEVADFVDALFLREGAEAKE